MELAESLLRQGVGLWGDLSRYRQGVQSHHGTWEHTVLAEQAIFVGLCYTTAL